MDIPTQCPVCGAFSMTHEGESSALLAVCDVLTIKALEKLGHYIVRADRSRFRELGTRPWHVAHTMPWPVDDVMVDKALKGAWDVVPALMDSHGCCDVTSKQVVVMLDLYVHDLAVTGSEHSLKELAYRFRAGLGLPVYLREKTDA